jgi:NNP family nitrate/nitrite transporter-like MFS transporter
MILPAAVRLLSSWFSEAELNKVMGIFGSGWGASQMVAFLVLPFLLVGGNWRLPLDFVVGFSLFVTLLAVFPARWKSGADTLGARSVKVDIKGLFTRSLLALTLPNFVSLVVLVGVFAWGSPFLMTRFALSNVEAGRIIALIGVTVIAASFLGGYAAQRIGGRAVIAISMILTVIFPILFGASNSPLAAVLWASGIGFAGTFYFAPVFALIPYAAKQGKAVAGIEFGVFNTLSNIGSFISPVLFGYVLDSGAGFGAGFAILGAFGLLGIMGALMLRSN